MHNNINGESIFKSLLERTACKEGLLLTPEESLKLCVIKTGCAGPIWLTKTKNNIPTVKILLYTFEDLMF